MDTQEAGYRVLQEDKVHVKYGYMIISISDTFKFFTLLCYLKKEKREKKGR